MPRDPRLAGISRSSDHRMAERLADLAGRVAALERTPTIITGSGAPTMAARDGAVYVDTTAHRLYVRSGGIWKFTALT